MVLLKLLGDVSFDPRGDHPDFITRAENPVNLSPPAT
jgi:hypothetical protein